MRSVRFGCGPIRTNSRSTTTRKHATSRRLGGGPMARRFFFWVNSRPVVKICRSASAVRRIWQARSGRLVSGQRFDLFETLLKLLVVVAQLVEILAEALTLLDAAAALANRCDGVVGVALDAAVEVAIGETPQSRQRAWVADLGESGRNTHSHHELAIVDQRRHQIENLDAPVLLERRKSRQRADRGHASARRPAVR